MADDEIFRIAILACMPLVFGIAGYHRVRAHRASPEPLDRRQEGVFMLATLRPVSGIMFIGIFAFLIRPASMSWASIPLPASVRWLGIAGMVLDAAFLWWTMRSLGKNLTDTVVTRRQHTLVTHGPYRWIRHPFYDAVALLVLSISIAMANWFVLLCGVAVFTLLIVRTNREEDRLVARFGESYRNYMASTGRFLPRL